MQVPFLVDTERDVSMYESDDMLNYIAEHYAK
jgi:glutathione S-transferase